MTAYAGSVPVSGKWLNNTHNSTNLRTGGGIDLTRTALIGSTPLSTGASVRNQPVTTSHAAIAAVAGFMMPGTGTYTFERIHILPPKKVYPFILSSQHVFLEVWNAFVATAQSVGAVIETGPAGIAILTAHAVPIAFAPMQSRTYDVLVNASGAPRANNTIQFDFTGIPDPVLTLTGLRLLPFTISPDWALGLDESVHFLTDVLTSYDTTEQRIMLRTIPARSIAYTALAADNLEASLLMGLVFAWQGRSYGVPMWQVAAPLGTSIPSNTQDLVVDTTGMDGLAVGGSVMLWMDAFRWFASTVVSFTASTLRIDAGTDQAFYAGATLVMPVFLGRLPDTVPAARPSNQTTSIPVKFELEVIPVLGGGPT